MSLSISDVINSINGITDSSDLQEEDRVALLAAITKLRSKIETTREATLRYILAPHQAVMLRLAIDMKLFDAAATLSASGSTFTIDDLASQTGADPLLVVRIVRFLAAMGIFEEVALRTFKSTPLSSAYVTTSPLAQGVIHMTSQNEVISALPAYFENNGYQNPTDAYDSPFQYARNTKLHSFEWLATQPKLQNAFNISMGIARSTGAQPWFEYFPVSTRLLVKDPSDPVLVDVGGGLGHDLIRFKDHNSSLTGRLILQDIPVVVESITDLPAGIEVMKHDFFAPQPVKGAKAYYLGNVIHDWPDKQAIQILHQIKEAMIEESILLINENTLPEEKVPLFSASADLVMMAHLSALERTEAQFKTLLENAGFVLVKVWTPDEAAKGEGRRLFEAVVRK